MDDSSLECRLVLKLIDFNSWQKGANSTFGHPLTEETAVTGEILIGQKIRYSQTEVKTDVQVQPEPGELYPRL